MNETSKNRIYRIMNIVGEEGADAVLVFNHELSGQPGTKYLSGFSGTESVLLIAENECFIFTDGRYFSQAREECPDFELIPTDRSMFWEELGGICRKLDLKKIVFDSVRTNYSQISRLKERLSSVSIEGMENILQKIRVVKDEAELEQIQKANDIAVKSFKEFLPFVKEGATEKELALKLDTLMRENGAEKVSFDTILASGINGAKPHARPSDKKIAKGELITIDFGCLSGGYASDITRTVALGKISGKLAEIYGTVRIAQELGYKAVKAGITVSEIDKVCRDYVSSKGYGEYFLHGTGHGVGMEVHELPYVSGSNKEPLPENSVITVEPGIYIDGIGGVRIEDTIAVKKDGSINMSGGPSPRRSGFVHAGGLSKELIVL